MITEETILITKYQGSWNWQIISIIFLNSSMILFAINKYIEAISLFIVFIVCEFFAFKRQYEIYNEGKNTGKARGKGN